METNQILITGATGLLGTGLRRILGSKDVFLSSRNPPVSGGDKWRAMDLFAKKGFQNALRGIDTVINLASATKGGYDRNVDVEGSAEFLKVSRESGVKHFIHVSIVGIDRVPMDYYRIKLEAEQVLKESGVPHSILRATQFHDFIEFLLQKFTSLPVALIAGGAKFQPVETAAVARLLKEMAQAEAKNRTVEIGGPEIYDLSYLAKTWLEAKKEKKWTLNLPLFLTGKLGRSLAAGGLLTSSRSVDSITWEDYLKRKYGFSYAFSETEKSAL